MKCSSLKIIALWAILIGSGKAGADIVVVVNKANPTESLSRAQVIDLFMGKYVAFPDGTRATPVEPVGNQASRQVFYKILINFPLSRVNAYWSRIRFTGRAKPPQPKPSDEDVAKTISETKNAIGYIDSKHLSDQLKIVYKLVP